MINLANLLKGIGVGGALAPLPNPFAQAAQGLGSLLTGAQPQQASAPAVPPVASPATAVGPANYIRYANQNATRNQPLDPKLTEALSFLPELGVEMEVFSGGQAAKGTPGAKRVGSTRHDHGQAADAFFYKDGRKLDWANPDDQPIFAEIVKNARARGVTGIGAGDGYMQPGSMHIGFGKEATWGAGGKGGNTAEWLRQAAAAPGSGAAPARTSALPQSFAQAVDRTEGAGSYDTLYGHADKSGPLAGTKVSQMTLGEAARFADPSGPYAQSVNKQIGRVATPMGRYQIVGSTLLQAAREMGLPANTPFDAKTQDAIAAHLAKKRVAASPTLEGKIAGLRAEWEGFKNVPDQQMASIVRDIETGGGAEDPAAARMSRLREEANRKRAANGLPPLAEPAASQGFRAPESWAKIMEQPEQTLKPSEPRRSGGVAPLPETDAKLPETAPIDTSRRTAMLDTVRRSIAAQTPAQSPLRKMSPTARMQAIAEYGAALREG